MDREQADISGLISFKNDTLFIKNDSGESFFLRQKEIPNLGNLIDDKELKKQVVNVKG